ncbi:MAG: DNA mismatch repair endonuclease MutL [Deltaproteobacteria bacterium]|nr:DNA mismatch repair endonuclease MutL [Deltaproteobacteria bacterium]
MSSRKSPIHILSDSVINNIAAGEVVERPASVVKELVENSLDSGADFVEITILDGGRSLIMVTDNGSGIHREDVELALLRHATSKINTSEDIFSISTYGFRGEALAAISSVTKMKITSRVETGDGYFVDFKSGSIVSEGPAVISRGTRIQCRDLFHNVPARRKFLKTDSTESWHVQDAVLKFSLIRPDVHFRLITDNKLTLDFPVESSRFQRASTVLHRRGRGSVSGELNNFTQSSDEINVDVICSNPDVSLRDSSGVYFFVNNRSIKDKGLMKGVTGAYGGLLDRGRYPIAVIYISMPSHSLDINVHPQKTEVRFSNDRSVVGAVRRAVSEALINSRWAPSGVREKTYTLVQNNFTEEKKSSGSGSNVIDTVSKTIDAALEKSRARNLHPFLAPSEKQISTKNLYKTDNPERRSVEIEYSSSTSSNPIKVNRDLFDSPSSKEVPSAKYLGSHGGLYLFFSTPRGVLVMDMHAAHERVRYNSLFEQYSKKMIVSSQLLFPEKISVSQLQMEKVLQYAEIFTGLGIEIDPFGKNEILVRAIPATLNKPVVSELIMDILDEVDSGGTGSNMGDKIPGIIATMACHSVKRKGDFITAEEAIRLYQDVLNTETGGFCPHGRPVSFLLELSEIETRFKRR